MSAMYVHIYEVIGRGEFPLDMLRYDTSHPARQEDVVALKERDPVVPIRLVCKSHAQWTPTKARWESFGWKVLNSTREMKL